MLGTKGVAQCGALACTASGKAVTMVSSAAAHSAAKALLIELLRGRYMVGLPEGVGMAGGHAFPIAWAVPIRGKPGFPGFVDNFAFLAQDLIVRIRTLD